MMGETGSGTFSSINRDRHTISRWRRWRRQCQWGVNELVVAVAVAAEMVLLVMLQGALVLQTPAVAAAVEVAIRIMGALAAPVSSSSSILSDDMRFISMDVLT